ncbi:uncharacterized [Tachysurus ichikawai]
MTTGGKEFPKEHLDEAYAHSNIRRFSSAKSISIMKDEHKALLLLGRMGNSEEGKGERKAASIPHMRGKEKKKKMGQKKRSGSAEESPCR